MFVKLLATFYRLRSDQRAVTAMEYGLIAALIALAIIASLTAVGASLAAKFTAISDAITGAGA